MRDSSVANSILPGTASNPPARITIAQGMISSITTTKATRTRVNSVIA